MANGFLRVAPALFIAGTLPASACFFGGGDKTVSVNRPNSIPTATPPASLPEPIVLSGSGSPTAGTRATGGGTTAGGADSYTVKPGDSLNAIATALGIPTDQQAAWVAEVLRLNGLPDARLLQAGQVLQLP